MNKDFPKGKLLSFNQSKKLKVLFDLAKYIERNALEVESPAFSKLSKYHEFLKDCDEVFIQKLNKEFSKIRSNNFQFQVYLMNLERMMGQSSKDYEFLVSQNDRKVSTRSFPIVCILDSIRSAHNVGAIIRTSECFGVSKVYTCGLTPQSDSSHVIKTAMGSEQMIECEHIDSAIELVKELKNEGFQIWSIETALDHPSLNQVSNVAEKVALIVGHEQFGVSKELLDLSDKIVPIELYGSKNSLNVSIAHGIVLNRVTDLLKD